MGNLRRDDELRKPAVQGAGLRELGQAYSLAVAAQSQGRMSESNGCHWRVDDSDASGKKIERGIALLPRGYTPVGSKLGAKSSKLHAKP